MGVWERAVGYLLVTVAREHDERIGVYSYDRVTLCDLSNLQGGCRWVWMGGVPWECGVGVTF